MLVPQMPILLMFDQKEGQSLMINLLDVSAVKFQDNYSFFYLKSGETLTSFVTREEWMKTLKHVTACPEHGGIGGITDDPTAN